MQTTFIEEKLQHQQIVDLCQYIDSDNCSALELRRCQIADGDFDLLMKSLSQHGKQLISLILNIQMIDESSRFKKFLKMLSNCSNLLQLQVHGNQITDEMFARLHAVLIDHCPRLILIDLGDNRLTNKSISLLCSLVVGDEKRTALEELILSANLSISNAGWTELFFAVSFNSHLRRLALDYNVLDNSIAAMLSMIIASSQTLIDLDLECCQLTEYAGQLFLTLFTKYPVKLEKICLDKNPSILDSTRELINECLGLKSRQNSISSEQPLMSFRLSLPDDVKSTTSTVVDEEIRPIEKEKPKKKKILSEQLKQTPTKPAKEPLKTVSFDENNKPRKPMPMKINQEEDDIDIEELLPIDIEPYGVVAARPYWNRV